MVSLISGLPTSSLVILGVVIAVGAAILGAISNTVLGDRGCGLVVNGLVVTLATLLGIATQFWFAGIA